MKKSYNPFKMWGSWIGLTLGILIMLPVLIGFFSNGCISSSGSGFFAGLLGGGTSSDSCLKSWVLFIPSIIGFLLGWGIHALIRKLRK